MKPRPPTRILLIEDNATFRRMAEAFLAIRPDFEIIPSARSGGDGLFRTLRLAPDVLLVDLHLPDMNGLEVTRRVKCAAKPPRVVIVTLFDSPEYRAAAAEVGADAFVAKRDFGAEILPTIDSLIGSFPEVSE